MVHVEGSQVATVGGPGRGCCAPEATMAGGPHAKGTTPNMGVKMDNLSAILQDSDAYGFQFVVEDVREKDENTSIVIGQGPILVITKPTLFEEKFPGRIAAMLDGSSARVISQRVVRDGWKQYRKAKPDERGDKPTTDSLKPRVLNAILGVKARTPVVIERKVFALPDGSTTQDEAEFRQAWGLPAE